MRLEQRTLGDVVVLDLIGKITVGAGDDMLKDAVASLLAGGARKFVLNLQAVPYVDSAGLGELVRTKIVIRRQKGELLLSHPLPRLFALFTITKLLTLYEILPSVGDAVAVFESRERGNALFDATCPVCDPVGKGRLSIWSFFDSCACTACGSTFRIIKPERPLVEVVDRSTASLWTMNLPAHQGETVNVEMESLLGGCVIHAPRRLDLFSIEVIEKAWSLIPEPRKIVLQVSAVEEFTDRAVARLLALGDDARGAGSAIYITQEDERFPPSPIAPRLAESGRAYDAAAQKTFGRHHWAGVPPVIRVTITRVSAV